MNKFVTGVVVIAFFGTCTNFIPLSALASLFGILFLPFSINFEKKIPFFLCFLYLFFSVSIISILLYDPSALINYYFYRYDGNFIVSYTPLLLIPLVSKKIDVKSILIKFIHFETAINLISFLVVLISNKFRLTADLSFGSLFIARNAAGGFFSFCITIIFLFFWEVKSKKNLFLLVTNTIFLLATYSRGSILGIAFCVLLYLFFEKNMGKIAIVFIIVALIFEVFLVSKTFDIYKKASSQYNGFDYVTESIGGEDTKSGNITIRLLFAWPSGIDEFMHSPIFGAGFGSINDKPYMFDSSIGLFNTNKQPVKVYDDAHAHNTYFHIGGEQGVFGLGLFIVFLSSMYMFFSNVKIRHANYSFVSKCILLYTLNISFMSLTEHRLTTPSNTLPLTLLIVLFFAEFNHKKNVKSDGVEELKLAQFNI